MNQNFTAEQVIKLLKKSELAEYNLTKEELFAQLVSAFDQIKSNSYSFKLQSHGAYFFSSDLVDKLIIRKLNDNIKKLYKDRQANRRMIIFQVKTLLEDECPMWIYRTDISSFYSSINRTRLIEKLQGDSLLSYFSVSLLKNLLSHSLLNDIPGLPQGLSISSSLSELYMRPFDKWIRSYNGIYYYARYVDDIIVFASKEETISSLDALLDEKLENGLKKNVKKTQKLNGKRLTDKKPLEFLGYKFFLENKQLIISIANSKINKIKTRIILTFSDFTRTNNAQLLERRIKFLTGNYSVRTTTDGTSLKAGIYYNYCYVNDVNVFKHLNLFYYKALSSTKFSLGKRLAPMMSPLLKNRLMRYSFQHGFNNKVFHSFDISTLKQIGACWK